MISLQKFLFNPEVAGTFDMSSTALYERQRSLVRVGLLPQAASRGRNSGGAMATPDTVAMIVLSVLVTDNLSEVDERMAVWAGLRAIEAKFIKDQGGEILRVGRCHFTNQKTLHKALAKAIADTGGNLEIELNRKMMIADIVDISGQSIPSRFGRIHPGSGVQLKATFNGLFNLGQLLEINSPQQPE
jgi:hypothetical protein